MGSVYSKEYLITMAIEKQDSSELRNLLKDFTPEQIRELCKANIPGDENECSVLHYAAWQDDPDLLAPFIDYIDDFEIRDALGWTPLMTAVNRGCYQNAKMLLSHGAKVDCDDMKGMTLVADAMNYADLELIELLVEHGALLNATPEMFAEDEEKQPFHLLNFAVDDGLVDVAKYLLEKGQVPLNTLDYTGWAPLHLAAGHNNLELLNLLLEKGADANIKDVDGNTPLAWAKQFEANDAMEILRRNGAFADAEWHGEKPELKHHEEEYAGEEGEEGDEEWTEEADYNEEEHIDGQPTNPAQPERFEIEVGEVKEKKTGGSFHGDALQRQRAAPKPVY